jgi:hypothetical protein
MAGPWRFGGARRAAAGGWVGGIRTSRFARRWRCAGYVERGSRTHDVFSINWTPKEIAGGSDPGGFQLRHNRRRRKSFHANIDVFARRGAWPVASGVRHDVTGTAKYRSSIILDGLVARM